MKRFFVSLALSLFTISSFSQTLPSWVPKNGLAAYYNFDGDARDASVNRNNGVVHSAALIPDRFGIDSSAYAFSGTASYIDVPDSPSLNPVNALTLSMWVHTVTPHGVAGVIGKWNNYGGTVGVGREQFCMNVSDTNNGINFGLHTEGNFAVYPHEKEIIYRNGKWNHYVGTYDGATAKLYVNGILASTYRASGPIQVYNQNFEIGRISGGQPTCATSFYFTGDLDDVGIWNKALTEKEVKALYSGCPGFITAKITPDGPTGLCAGGTVTLTSNTEPGATYQWFRNDTLIAGAADSFYVAGKTGNFSVIVSKGECSSTSEPVGVTVTPVPAPVITSSSPLTFCAGGSVTLSVPAGSNSTYSWNSGSTASSVSVTQSGTYSVTVTTSGCPGTSLPVTVTVKPNPVATITASGPVAFCEGGSVMLTAGGGETYSWNSGESARSITVKSSGTYTAEVTANGCKSMVSLPVTVHPRPVVSITPLDQFIDFKKSTIPLSGNPAGGIFAGKGAGQTSFSPSGAGLGKSVITYSFTSPEGCTGSAFREVIVYDTTGVVCSTFDTLTVVKYDTLHVTKYDTLQVIQRDTLRYSLSTIVADTLVIIVTSSKSGEQITQNLITLYPNPAKTVLNIRFTDFAIRNNYALVIKNALGQQLFVSEAITQEQRIKLDAWASGIYFVYLEDSQGYTIEVKKVIIQ